jgi:hypothetical protein
MANGLAEVRGGAGLKDRHFSSTAGIRKHKLALDDKFFYDDFSMHPSSVQNDGTLASGVGGEVNILNTGNLLWEQCQKGTQTIIVPPLVAGGLNVGLDQTDNDGVELTLGILSRNRAAFTVGTHAFYAKLKFSIATVLGTDDCAFGFRKAEAYQANFDNYADLASLNVIEGNINIETIVGGTATVTTDTTNDWVDAETHTLGIYVDLGGKVTYSIDDAPPTETAAYTFTAATVVVPFFFMLQANAAQTGIVALKEFECGLSDADVR